MAQHFPCVTSLLFIVHCICLLDSWPPYRKLPLYEQGDIYNSTKAIKVVPVINKAECAVICNDMGNETCLSFNVIADTQTIKRCEIFDHRPTAVADLLPSQSGVFYEQLCTYLTVMVASKVTLPNNDTLVMIIDDNQRVYQVYESSPKISLIGLTKDVFVKFEGIIEDILPGNVWPFLDTRLIRKGQFLYCFVPVTDRLDRFEPCPGTDIAVPLSYFKIVPEAYLENTHALLWLASKEMEQLFAV